MLSLDNVTLLSIAGSNKYVEPTKRAMRHCLKRVSFARTVLFSPEEDDEFENIKIPYLDTALYNKFCVEKLNDYVDTDFCLIVQWDGFVIDTNFWKDEFLDYDYIGSPWASHGFKIGNGGFSLRSKKFLKLSSELKYASDSHLKNGISPTQFVHGTICPEDWFLCVDNADYLHKNNVLFPSPELAYDFSVEHQGVGVLPGHEDKGEWVCKTFNPTKIETYQSFGFHGVFNTAGMKELLK